MENVEFIAWYVQLFKNADSVIECVCGGLDILSTYNMCTTEMQVE